MNLLKSCLKAENRKAFRKVSLLRNQALLKELFSIGKKAKRVFLLKMPTGS